MSKVETVFSIYGKLQGRGQEWELIDSADTKETAKFLLQEYTLAFPNDYSLKLVKERCE